MHYESINPKISSTTKLISGKDGIDNLTISLLDLVIERRYNYLHQDSDKQHRAGKPHPYRFCDLMTVSHKERVHTAITNATIAILWRIAIL
ncbi:hypothetical protein [Anabaena sp. UHCC 0204]|uniref:hypothetical protein n=1 Tax=Anabaena sp. UHCC 0204 TaxID=2590009 RepID=UPI001447EDCA|nr:hypothetical protein [Anabaena sp. UHCC 0204]MTJ06162.1 hypothetical protein [Anabaena sp. UHCC 0204]